MSLFQLPVDLQNNILDIYVDIQSYWRQQFTQSVLPLIKEKNEHRKAFQFIHFELEVAYVKKKLCSYSASGALFAFKHRASKQSYENPYIWYILFDGFKYINGQSKRITLLFEKYYPYSDNSYTIMESAGIFPLINNDHYSTEDFGRTYLQNYPSFIEKFMNAIFTYRH